MLTDRLEKYIAQSGMIARNDKILLAVSGGVDSTVMLDMFVKLGYTVGVAHCNFQLRGNESVEDEQLVTQKCAEYGIAGFNKRFDTQAEIDSSGESLQMVARRLRYDWFEEIRQQEGYTKIAIAHNADDAIETFFINLLRGCGINGLTGIHPEHGHVVRPILFAHRRDIVEYAVVNNIKYREDSSNASTKYIRNKLRLGVMPKLKEIVAKFPQIMIGNIGRLVECQEFVSKQIGIISAQVSSQRGDAKVIDLDAINPELPLKFVLWEMLQPLGYNNGVVENICQCYMNHDSGRKFFAPEYIAYLDRNELLIKELGDDSDYFQEINGLNEKVNCPCGVITLSDHFVGDLDNYRRPSNYALIDSDLLTLPLIVRRWLPGDQFVPFGMSGHKKVSDYLIDEKVSLLDKESQMVVVSAGEIVWLAGHRIADKYKITDSTTRYVELVLDV